MGSFVLGEPILDLQNPHHSYLFGFLNGDGSLSENTRNRGRVGVELSGKDRIILEAFRSLLPVYSCVSERTRATNFKKEYSSCTWTVCNLQFREELKRLGLPVGKKSKVTKPPTCPFRDADFYRAIVDTDGSVGFDCKGTPFISICTSSNAMARAYEQLVYDITGITKYTNPNKRDGAYNILLMKEPAQILTSYLYYPGCLALPRKHAAAIETSPWRRDKESKSRSRYPEKMFLRAASIPAQSPYSLEDSLCSELASQILSLPQPGTQTFWSDEIITEALKKFCRGKTKWPTTNTFHAAGQTALLSAVASHGGTKVWSERMKLPLERRYDEEWSPEDDALILAHSPEKAAKIIKVSINQARWRREKLRRQLSTSR